MKRMIAPATAGVRQYPFKASPYSSHTLLLQELAGRGDGCRLLDVGCWAGYVAAAAAARGYSVTGVDLPGTPFPDGISVVAADLDQGLPALALPFDIILCADVLEHLRDPVQLLRECRRHLAPEGVLLASLPNSGNFYFRWNVLRGRFPRHDHGLFDRTHLRFYMWNDWTDLLAQAGFRIEAVQKSGVPVGLAWPRWNGSIFVRALEWLSFQLARVWSKMFAYQFIVRARPEEVR
jgi:SAM-dependent methyltransferase